MLRLLTEPGLYEKLSAGARDRASRYTWDAFVGRIDEYLDRLQPAAARAYSITAEHAHRV
jgi:hypothetical protein